jgi:diguanylate cyclase (GGDEF)-like protein
MRLVQSNTPNTRTFTAVASFMLVLFAALACLAFIVFYYSPDLVSCLNQQCDPRTIFQLIGTLWLWSLPLLVFATMIATRLIRVFAQRSKTNPSPNPDRTLSAMSSEEISSSFQNLARELKAEREQRERAEHRAYFAETHDALTGLLNRTHMLQKLDDAIRRAEKDESSVAVFFLDMDEFKKINDSFGHNAGDQFLRLVADRLRRVVNTEDSVARLGGDEFLVMVEGLDEKSNAKQIADRLLSEVAKPCAIENQEVSVTTSVGVSVYPQDAKDAHMMIRRADTAMYIAKSRGPNQAVLCC